MKVKILTGLFLLSAVLAIPSAHAVPMIIWGNLTINVSGTYNVTPDGANVTVHINGSDRITDTFKAGVGIYFGATTTAASGYYMTRNLTCNLGDNVSFRVFNVTALLNSTWSGYPCGTDIYNATSGTHLYINMTALQNGSFCTDNKACITGICAGDYDGAGSFCVPSGSCAHNGAVRASGYAECADISTLRSCTAGAWTTTTCTCSNNACVPAGGTTPTSSSTTPTTTPSAPTETTITDTAVINEIITGLSPQDLGLTAIAASDVTIKQIGTTTETTTQTTATIADLAIQIATDANAKTAIENIKNDVAAGNSVDVKVSLSVYKVENPSTNQSVYVSKVQLSFTAPSNMKNVDIVQIIPKSIANQVSELVFLTGTPAVLQSDPVVKWSFPEVQQGETKSMAYTVKKQLSGTAEITTLAAANETKAKPPVVCIAGNTRCSGGNIEQCSSEGRSWQVTKTCENGCDELSQQCNLAPGVTPTAAREQNFTYAIAVIVIGVILLLIWAYKKMAR